MSAPSPAAPTAPAPSVRGLENNELPRLEPELVATLMAHSYRTGLAIPAVGAAGEGWGGCWPSGRAPAASGLPSGLADVRGAAPAAGGAPGGGEAGGGVGATGPMPPDSGLPASAGEEFGPNRPPCGSAPCNGNAG